MKSRAVPHFEICNNFQKANVANRVERDFEEYLPEEILSDVALKITGSEQYTVNYIDEVNEGKLAKLYFDGFVHYISFTDKIVNSRNSYFQSFPSALLRYLNEENSNKSLNLYVLNPTNGIGKINTNYHYFMYRVINFLGTSLFSEVEGLLDANRLAPFTSAEDLIVHKQSLRDKNSSNNSTFITKSDTNSIQVFSKVYGANKYESTLLSIALFKLTDLPIEVYEIKEGNLKKLPKIARDYLLSLPRISVITSDIEQEEKEYKENNSLRSPRYISNLLAKLGSKKCCLCDCDIPQVIQGAHIWAVSDIKKVDELSNQDKLTNAIDGDNGLWLCQNHHKLFDSNLLAISMDRNIYLNNSLLEKGEGYFKEITKNVSIDEEICNENFLGFLEKRNQELEFENYTQLVI